MSSFNFKQQQQAPDLQGVITGDLYSQPMPSVDGVKQVIEALADKVQALTPEQLKAVGYLRYLQSRAIHNGEKVYQDIIDDIIKEAPRVAPPGFFIRVIESLVPRPMHVDSKTYDKMVKESNGNR